MSKFNRHRELEVFLTTFDGAQHLRLHGWLKRNDVLIKSENIVKQDDYFGVFTIYTTENQLNKLKDQNIENSLFLDLEVMSTESERWSILKNIRNKDEIIENYIPGTKKGTKIILKQGDMLVYKGFDLEHWREPLKKGRCSQLFLHYIDVKDPDAENKKYDGRHMLGIDVLIKKKNK